jgi:hypothetical protein
MQNFAEVISTYVRATRRLESLPSSTETTFYPDLKLLLSAVLKIEQLPFDVRGQPRDHGWRQVQCGLAQEGGERLLEVAGRHPAQVENRQQRVETLRPPRPLRQNR